MATPSTADKQTKPTIFDWISNNLVLFITLVLVAILWLVHGLRLVTMGQFGGAGHDLSELVLTPN